MLMKIVGSMRVFNLHLFEKIFFLQQSEQKSSHLFLKRLSSQCNRMQNAQLKSTKLSKLSTSIVSKILSYHYHRFYLVMGPHFYSTEILTSIPLLGNPGYLRLFFAGLTIPVF